MFRFAEPELHRELQAAADTFGSTGFTFSQLARCAARRGLTESLGVVADWLAAARLRGEVVELATSPPRYRLS